MKLKHTFSPDKDQLDDLNLRQFNSALKQDLQQLKEDIFNLDIRRLLDQESKDYEKNIPNITNEEEQILKDIKNVDILTLSDLEKKKLKLIKRAIYILVQSLENDDIDVEVSDYTAPFHLDGSEIDVYTNSNLWRLWTDVDYLTSNLLGDGEEWTQQDVDILNSLYMIRLEKIKKIIFMQVVNDLKFRVKNGDVTIEEMYEQTPFQLDGEDIEASIRGINETVLDDDDAFWSGGGRAWTQQDVDELNQYYTKGIEGETQKEQIDFVKNILQDIRISMSDIDGLDLSTKHIIEGFSLNDKKIMFFGKDVTKYRPEYIPFNSDNLDVINKEYYRLRTKLIEESFDVCIQNILDDKFKLKVDIYKVGASATLFYIDDGDIKVYTDNWGSDPSLLEGASAWGVDLGWAGNYKVGNLPFIWKESDVLLLNQKYNREFVDKIDKHKNNLIRKTVRNVYKKVLDGEIDIETQYQNIPFFLDDHKIRIYTSRSGEELVDSGISWNESDIENINQRYIQEKIKIKNRLKKRAVYSLIKEIAASTIEIEINYQDRPFYYNKKDNKIWTHNSGQDKIYLDNNIARLENDAVELNEEYSKQK